jgi:hypothetical protein
LLTFTDKRPLTYASPRFFHVLSLQVLLFLQNKLKDYQDEDDVILQAQDIEDLGMAGDEDLVVEITQLYFGQSIQVAKSSYCSQCLCCRKTRKIRI